MTPIQKAKEIITSFWLYQQNSNVVHFNPDGLFENWLATPNAALLSGEDWKEDGWWVELKEGNDLPDYDEYVLWLSEDGSIHWDALDKDGNDHIFKGYKLFDDGPLIKTTHWRRIKTP